MHGEAPLKVSSVTRELTVVLFSFLFHVLFIPLSTPLPQVRSLSCDCFLCSSQDCRIISSNMKIVSQMLQCFSSGISLKSEHSPKLWKPTVANREVV